MRGIITAGMLLLTGCATGADIPTSDYLFNRANSTFVGRPFDEVRLRYGDPASEVPHGNLTVYQFPASNTLTHHQRVQTRIAGSVGEPGYRTPYQATVTERQPYSATYNCMMRVGVKADGTVHGVDFVGQMGACQVFMP